MLSIAILYQKLKYLLKKVVYRSPENCKESVQHIYRLKLDTIGRAEVWQWRKAHNCMRRKEAVRCDKAAGWRLCGAGRGAEARQRGARVTGARAAAGPARAASPGRQSPADSACACVTRRYVHSTRAPNTTTRAPTAAANATSALPAKTVFPNLRTTR